MLLITTTTGGNTHRVNGGDLYKRLLDRGAFPEHAAKKLFLQLLVGVSYLHSRNIAHRDLKVCVLSLAGNNSNSTLG